jgi:hypothetical protein
MREDASSSTLAVPVNQNLLLITSSVQPAAQVADIALRR